MTLHIEIDRKTEEALTAMAKLNELSVEDVASHLLANMIKAEDARMAKLRYEVKRGFEQADRGEFSTATAEDIIREGQARYEARRQV